MKIVKPSVEVFFHYPQMPHVNAPIYPTEFIEKVGRTCYKSEDAIAPGTASKFVSMLVKRGHMAMIEHCVASVKFVCDRGVSHELVRHRICSFAQESTRYVNYGKEKFGGEISVIKPPFTGTPEDVEVCEKWWSEAVYEAEQSYLALIKHKKVPPEIARAVLPTCLKTEIWATANLREWKTIFDLRTSSAAHPQIRELMEMAKAIFVKEIPEVFGEQ